MFSLQDVAALQRLVNASIAALRNASNSNSPIPSTQSSPRIDPPNNNNTSSNGKVLGSNDGSGSGTGSGSGFGGRGGYPPSVRQSFQPSQQQQQSSRYSYWSITRLSSPSLPFSSFIFNSKLTSLHTEHSTWNVFTSFTILNIFHVTKTFNSLQ